MFEKLKLLQRILLGYSVPILLSILVAILVYVSALSVEKQVQVVSAKYSVVILTNHLDLSTVLIGRASRGYLVAKNERYRKEIDDAEKEFDSTIDTLKKVVTDPRQQEALGKIDATKAEYIGIHRQVLSLVDQGREAEAFQRFRSGEATSLYEKIDSLIKEFDKHEYEILNSAQKAEADSLRFLIIAVWAGALLAAILAIAIGLFIASRITASIVTAINAISSTSTEISATVEQHERTATQQAASVNETTSTMAELATSSRTASEQADAAATAAQKAATLTAEGGKTVKEAVDGMNRLKERVEAIGQQILRLSEQTGQIGNIANLVKDLAGQTNMLALNAAVEAARAGEQGKGFAVVAAEIRKLADQSRKSSEQIAALIAEIQKSTNTTVMTAEEGTKTVETVLQLDQKVVEAFNNLSASETAIFENVQQVMLNAKQQAEAIKMVDEAMNSIAAGAKDTAAGISQTRVGIQKLDETAKALKGMV